MLFTLVYLTLFYFIVGFQSDANKFFQQYVILLLFLLISETIGYVCAYTASNSTVGVILLSLVLIVCLSMSGFLVSEPREYTLWFEKINYFTYAYTASVLVEFTDLQLVDGNDTIDGLSVIFASGRLRNDLSIEENISVLIAFLISLRMLCLPLLYYRILQTKST